MRLNQTYRCALVMVAMVGVVGLAPSVLWAKSTVGPCTLPLIIRATMVAEDMPSWSLARITNTETGHTGTYALNKERSLVMGGVVLTSIESLAVTLRTPSGFQRCWAEGHVFTGEKGAGAATGSNGTAVVGRAVSPELKALMTELTKLRFDDYRGPLSEDVPGIWRENNRGIRQNNFKREGTGFQLVKLRAESLAYAFGLRNFDIVKEIDGAPIDDPRKALGVLNAATAARKMTITLQRQGRMMTLDLGY